MKWATVADHEGKQYYGVIKNNGQTFIDIPKLAKLLNSSDPLPDTLLDALQLGDQLLEAAAKLLEKGKDILQEVAYRLEKLKLLAPIPRTRKNIFCVGKNYREHVKEMGPDPIPEHLIIFTKPPTAIIGCYETIPPSYRCDGCPRL